CFTAGLEHLWATGVGSGVTPNMQSSLSFVIGAGGTAHFSVSENLALFASLGLALRTARPILVLDALGTVGQVGAAQLSFGLGPEWIF
ncbi:MAG TPA: hypothetical protein VGK73_06465, partial [Polyangiaceae bacterium]